MILIMEPLISPQNKGEGHGRCAGHHWSSFSIGGDYGHHMSRAACAALRPYLQAPTIPPSFMFSWLEGSESANTWYENIVAQKLELIAYYIIFMIIHRLVTTVFTVKYIID